MAPMLLEIITAERQVYGDDVDMVVAPGADGQLGILPHHAPLMTMLQPGEILIRKEGADTFMAVTGGFMEVIGNRVIILADAAERADEIDETRAQEAVQRAQERIAGQDSELQMERALGAMRRAQVRLNIARRRRSRGGIGPGGGDQGPGGPG